MKTYTTFLTVALTVSVSILTLSVTATKHIVLVGNFYFNPSGIPDVVVGDTIRWEWVRYAHHDINRYSDGCGLLEFTHQQFRSGV